MWTAWPDADGVLQPITKTHQRWATERDDDLPLFSWSTERDDDLFSGVGEKKP